MRGIKRALTVFCLGYLAWIPSLALAIVNGQNTDIQMRPEIGLLVSFDEPLNPTKLKNYGDRYSAQSLPVPNRCSGVFISDSKLLTAGHCVRSATGPVEVFLHRWDEKGKPFLLKSVSVLTPYVYENLKSPITYGPVPGCSPGLKPLPNSKTADLAVVEFPKGSSSKWVEVDPHYIPKLNDHYEYLGFGMTQNPYASQVIGTRPHTGDLNQGSGLLARFSDQRLELINFDSKPFAAEGDSGGPVFHAGKLIAILSTISTRCDTEFGEDYAIQNTATRLTPEILGSFESIQESPDDL